MQKYLFTLLAIAGLSYVLFGFGKPEPDPAPPHTEGEGEGPYPKDYFQRPILEDMLITGTFGELRPGHFHAGLDIKSNSGRVGQAVHAAADGYVDRIKVLPSGYGNVLYVKHPNGYTTLYGHLDRFAPEIQKFVQEQQYKRERFEIELNPPPTMFKVKKGQEIAFLGNSGSSSGPHLHFEIRNTATQKALNPLLFGIPVPDHIAPDIRDMKVYFLNDKREVNGSKALPVVKLKDGTYHLKGGDTISLGAWRVGFGVKSYDSSDKLRNDNGIYALSVYADNKLAYQLHFDEIDFDEARYLNAHCDYAVQQRFGAWFHRGFVLPGDRFSGYERTDIMGAIPLTREQPVKISLKVSDAELNTSTIIFWVYRSDDIETFAGPPYQYDLPYDADSRIDLEGFYTFLPKGVLYESLHYQFSSTPDNSSGVYSSMYQLHNGHTPAHKYFEVGIRPLNLPAELRDKAVIAACGDGRPDNCGGTWKGDMLVTKVRNFGNYCVMIDTTPPTITPVIFTADMRKKTSMAFRLRDNFAVAGDANNLSFRGTIDGQWVLFQMDRKRDRITYTFDERVGPGDHTVKIVVKDDKGNVRVLEKGFKR